MTDTTLAAAPASDASEQPAVLRPGDSSFGRCIVVADRGHVWTAEGASFDADWAHLTNAQAVRRWGTSEGLNELAAKGPRPNTRLDAKADLMVSRKAIIAVIPSEADKWAA